MLQIASATYRKQPNYLSEQNFVVYSATAKSTFAQRKYFWTGEFLARDQPDRVPELTCLRKKTKKLKNVRGNNETALSITTFVA